MSKEYLKRPQQNTANNTAELQKKIDPVAQRNWINNHSVDPGWGIYGDNPSTQLKENINQENHSDEGMQIHPNNYPILHNFLLN